MPDANIAFAKIVSGPKSFSWSQAYNAGKLFAVLSLEKDIVNIEYPDFLNILGKDTLGKLEEEFFTLDFKDLESIKHAISKTFENIQKGINYSFAASFFVNNTLYLFTINKGTVFIRRGSKIAKSFLQNENPKSIISSSGFIENNDLIILTTNSLPDIITNEAFSALGNLTPNEIKEALVPKIQEREDGKTAAIIIKYTESKAKDELKKIQEETPRLRKNYISLLKNYLPIKNIELNHANKVTLTLTLIILIIFILSVHFSIRKQESSKTYALFNKNYLEAQKKYNEGDSLLGLNKNLAKSYFLESQKILESVKDKFAKNPKEEKQILALLKRVNDALIVSSSVNLLKAKSVDSKFSNFLLLQIRNASTNQFAQDDKNIYFADGQGVYSVAKATLDVEKAKEKINTIIKNVDLWKTPGGLGVYLGNIYVLDKNPSRNSRHGQILKFVATANGYSKTNYLSQDLAPDFSQATSIAIDGSIYVLLSNGAIEKFTRGKEEHFIVSSLDKPFSSPSRIFTNIDTKNLYILDNGNSRIVVLSKDGAYQTQYQSDIFKNAKDFEVKETDKKVYVLSQNKIYEIATK